MARSHRPAAPDRSVRAAAQGVLLATVDELSEAVPPLYRRWTRPRVVVTGRERWDNGVCPFVAGPIAPTSNDPRTREPGGRNKQEESAVLVGARYFGADIP